MSAYNDNPDVAGDYVWIKADDNTDRRSRAAQANAERRRYEREHGVTLTLIAKTYSETHGFLHQSAFRYEIGRPGQVFTLSVWSVRGHVYPPDGRQFPTMAAAQAHVRTGFRGASSFWRVTINAPDGRQSQQGTRAGRNGTGERWYFEPVPAS